MGMTERHVAETARRRALAIEALPATADLENERRACVAVWNDFCKAELARMTRAPAPKFAQILPGVFVRSR